MSSGAATAAVICSLILFAILVARMAALLARRCSPATPRCRPAGLDYELSLGIEQFQRNYFNHVMEQMMKDQDLITTIGNDLYGMRIMLDKVSDELEALRKERAIPPPRDNTFRVEGGGTYLAVKKIDWVALTEREGKKQQQIKDLVSEIRRLALDAGDFSPSPHDSLVTKLHALADRYGGR